MENAELTLPGFELLGKEVAVGEIDRELHAFFTSDQGVARASLLNLAVYSEDPNSLEKNTATIRELTRETACRAILILSIPGVERSVRSWIEAHCNLTDSGEKAVCSEQVSFVLGGSSANLVRNIVFAHLDADLPLITWWQGELSDIFEERLYSRIDRLIFDSREWANPAAQLLRVTVARDADGEEDCSGSFVPHDLSYTRTNAIRAAIASCFDDPRAREQIPALSEAEIVFAPGHRMSGLWLAAWLAGRLGCRLDENESQSDRYVLRRAGAGMPLTITLIEEASDDPKNLQALSRIRLGADGSQVTIKRSEDRAFWYVVSEMPEMPVFEELIPIRDLDDAGLVGEILRRSGQNRVMCSAMTPLRELLTV